MKKSKFISEFKEFISRGNVVDLAVGVIIGSAFTAIVNSLVNQIIMPVIGFIIGGINFSDFKWTLKNAEGDTPEVAVYFGSFIQQVVNFLIIAFVVFMMVKLINMLKRKKEKEIEEIKEEKVSKEEILLTEIRDLLRK
ncbi:large-conductance mechanosensitive channel protein MscL [Ruminiclostridium cellulolyticum]|uniref:Large-conductance mechanosensitive channel n=1 Tax=Ruminiclostridium cellulolyticum (strain ATCC 35319 / DSM 5812 / JCM 6584 / H10) TaxID=394503 RepID=B8I1I1_RUMCH|nr:large-conductance mechanosensitive channel protein MscL [Ruminiclostridium cellulolyticum]ACL75779.1 large conductance mechanosensitive channel protein [Ruminiclostridium cellulolyticum H10]